MSRVRTSGISTETAVPRSRRRSASLRIPIPIVMVGVSALGTGTFDGRPKLSSHGRDFVAWSRKKAWLVCCGKGIGGRAWSVVFLFFSVQAFSCTKEMRHGEKLA